MPTRTRAAGYFKLISISFQSLYCKKTKTCHCVISRLSKTQTSGYPVFTWHQTSKPCQVLILLPFSPKIFNSFLLFAKVRFPFKFNQTIMYFSTQRSLLTERGQSKGYNQAKMYVLPFLVISDDTAKKSSLLGAFPQQRFFVFSTYHRPIKLIQECRKHTQTNNADNLLRKWKGILIKSKPSFSFSFFSLVSSKVG